VVFLSWFLIITFIHFILICMHRQGKPQKLNSWSVFPPYLAYSINPNKERHKQSH